MKTVDPKKMGGNTPGSTTIWKPSKGTRIVLSSTKRLTSRGRNRPARRRSPLEIRSPVATRASMGQPAGGVDEDRRRRVGAICSRREDPVKLALIVPGGFDGGDREETIPALVDLAEALAARHE